MVWPTLGSRTAKEQNRTDFGIRLWRRGYYPRFGLEGSTSACIRNTGPKDKYQLSLIDPRDKIVLYI